MIGFFQLADRRDKHLVVQKQDLGCVLFNVFHLVQILTSAFMSSFICKTRKQEIKGVKKKVYIDQLPKRNCGSSLHQCITRTCQHRRRRVK